MKKQLFFVDFVRDYGLKEGIILSELCRRTCMKGSAAFHFSVADCSLLFDYMTEKQIRTALNNLLLRGCICHSAFRKNLDRTLYFQVSNSSYQAYFSSVIGDELREGIS